MEQRLIRMEEHFRITSTVHRLLTMYHSRRNSSPESRPNALKAILAPAICVDLPALRQRMSDPHRDQILVLEEVVSNGYQLSTTIDLPW